MVALGTPGWGWTRQGPTPRPWSVSCPTCRDWRNRLHRPDGGRLRGRLGLLGGVYKPEMHYRDPHTAAPALWALRHGSGCEFEASVVPGPGSVVERKALEAVAITLYRIEAGHSPPANFGRIPSGYRCSTGNSTKLVAVGRRARGGPDPAGCAPVAPQRSGSQATWVETPKRVTGWAGRGAPGNWSETFGGRWLAVASIG